MTKKMQYLRTGLVAILVASCTTFTARQVDPRDPNVRGLLIPQRIPFLVIENGVVRIDMVNSPDRATAIEFGAFLAKHDVQVDFHDNGALKMVKSNQDSTAIPLKLLEVAGSLAEHLLPEGAGFSGAEGRTATSTQVYRIVFRDGNIDSLVPLFNQGNFPPPQLRYETVPVTGGTPVGQLPNKANPPSKGN